MKRSLPGWLAVAVTYCNVKSIIEMEVESCRNANKFEEKDLEKFVKNYYQWSLKNN